MSNQVRRGRAAPMAPDERRRAIVDAVVPLLLEHGDDVSTKQIAEAAGIAEGTIFRVFPDKPALLMAAAAEAMSPANGRADLAAALEGLDSLRDKVLVTTDRMHARSEKVMVVLMALRRIWMAQARTEDGPREDPQKFFRESNRSLHLMLTDVFEPHRDELTVDPETAAVVLRTLVLGSRHPGSDPAHHLSSEQIATVLLDGITTKGDRPC
ncbi:MAG: helix-turn-helix domain-containing protein [Nocardioidaceae bacterium]